MVTQNTDVLPSRVLSLMAHQMGTADRISLLGQGDDFRAFVIGNRWVVRVARHASAAAGLRREASLLGVLSTQLPLRIPQPVARYSGSETEPAFAVHSMVPGSALTRAEYEALPVGARNRCARAVGEFLAALHQTDLALARGTGVPPHEYSERCVAMLTESHAELPPFLLGVVEAHRYCSYEPVLLHGDLSPDHVMWDASSQEVTGIIDFGDMAVGDPAWDFVYLYDDYGPDFVERALSAYTCEDPVALLRRVRGLQFIEMIVWLAQAAGEEAVGSVPAHSSIQAD
jgi:aminoglycoside 2''-phosphotransferase